MAKQRYAQGGQAGRKPAAGRKAGKSGAGKSAGRKPPKGGRASRTVLAALTFLNLLLTFLLHVQRRVEIIHAVRSEDGAKVLLEARKKTEARSGRY